MKHLPMLLFSSERLGMKSKHYLKYHQRSRAKKVNRLLYWFVRLVFVQPPSHLLFRFTREQRGNIPRSGPFILAANHRSFFDPFVIAMGVNQPMYFVAKKELFRRGLCWIITRLGGFPVDRGSKDGEGVATAVHLLERGDSVTIFIEGTRVQEGGMAPPKKGVALMALKTGVPVVPVAVYGTENIRHSGKAPFLPTKVRVRYGIPLTFRKTENPSPEHVKAVQEIIWDAIRDLWLELGGSPKPGKIDPRKLERQRQAEHVVETA